MDAQPFNKRKNLKNLQISESEKIERIHKETGKSTKTIRNRISLLDLPKTLQNLIETDHFPPSYGLEL